MGNSGRTTERKMRCRRLTNLNDDVEITLAYFRHAIKDPTNVAASFTAHA